MASSPPFIGGALMDVVVLVGRVLYAFLFLGSAVGHLTKSADMSGYASSKGVPAARIMVIATGVQLLVGGLMVLFGVWGDLGSLLVALFLVGAAFLMHAFWKETEPMGKQMEMVQFNKDVALAGAALAFFWVFQNGVGLTLTDGLFS
jgi:putative oxidoreductase